MTARQFALELDVQMVEQVRGGAVDLGDHPQRDGRLARVPEASPAADRAATTAGDEWSAGRDRP